MKDNRIELADVVRRFKDRYGNQFGHLMMPSHKKALRDIANCMTPQMGGHQFRCGDCDHTGHISRQDRQVKKTPRAGFRRPAG